MCRHIFYVYVISILLKQKNKGWNNVYDINLFLDNLRSWAQATIMDVPDNQILGMEKKHKLCFRSIQGKC